MKRGGAPDYLHKTRDQPALQCVASPTGALSRGTPLRVQINPRCSALLLLLLGSSIDLANWPPASPKVRASRSTEKHSRLVLSHQLWWQASPAKIDKTGKSWVPTSSNLTGGPSSSFLPTRRVRGLLGADMASLNLDTVGLLFNAPSAQKDGAWRGRRSKAVLCRARVLTESSPSTAQRPWIYQGSRFPTDKNKTGHAWRTRKHHPPSEQRVHSTFGLAGWSVLFCVEATDQQDKNKHTFFVGGFFGWAFV